VSDHLEILFDLDIEARDKAAQLGITYYRTQMPNTRQEFIEVLASVVREHLEAPAPCWCYPSLNYAPVTFVEARAAAPAKA
jgi:ferrochelatase